MTAVRRFFRVMRHMHHFIYVPEAETKELFDSVARLCVAAQPHADADDDPDLERALSDIEERTHVWLAACSVMGLSK